MRETIIAGNWKMNTTPAEGVALLKEIIQVVAASRGVTVVICPPATHIAAMAETAAGSSVEIGAQNVHWAEKGAFTGEVSAAMLKELGCRWVIIGHSERRAYFGETDESVNMRLRTALAAGLRPIVCIGELREQREAGETFDVLRRQIHSGLDGAELKGSGGLVIAYEPVWAIGTGLTATPDQAEEAHAFIRQELGEMFSREAADATVIQYGGSMNAVNAGELLARPDVDGGLIGGASLKADAFAAIVAAGARSRIADYP